MSAIATPDAGGWGWVSPASGLVLSPTSGSSDAKDASFLKPPVSGGVFIDRVQARLSRMRSSVQTSARLILGELQQAGGQYKPYMITLTYRPGVEWEPYHVTDCIRRYRLWASDLGIVLRYVWVAEIQGNRYANGALLGECVHYHLLLWLPARLVPPKPDKQGWWVHGMTQRVLARKPVNYLTKYSTKGVDVEFPKGLRTHAFGGLSANARNERTWLLMPRWVRTLFSAADMPRRCKGGGIISRKTGQVTPSIWSVVLDGGGVFCWIREDVYRLFSKQDLFLLYSAGIIPSDPSLLDFDSYLDRELYLAWTGSGNCSGNCDF